MTPAALLAPLKTARWPSLATIFAANPAFQRALPMDCMAAATFFTDAGSFNATTTGLANSNFTGLAALTVFLSGP